MKTKPHTTKAHKKHHHKKGAKKGLSGHEKLDAAKKKSGEAGITKPLGVILGLGVASGVGYVLDKVPFLKPDETKEGFQIKSLVKPVILLGVGATGIVLTHKKTGNAMAFANGLSWGIAGGGAFSGVKSVLKVDVFKGLGADPNAKKQALTIDYYKDKAEDMAKLLEKSRHEINLPDAEENKVQELQGGENVVSEMQFDENNLM